MQSNVKRKRKFNSWKKWNDVVCVKLRMDGRISMSLWIVIFIFMFSGNIKKNKFSL